MGRIGKQETAYLPGDKLSAASLCASYPAFLAEDKKNVFNHLLSSPIKP